MPTGDSYVHLYSKKIIGHTALATKFFDYLKEQTEDLAATIYSEGVFTAVTIAGTVNDKFDLIATDGQDGLGRHLERAAASWSFENTAAQWYDIGFMYAETPDQTIETNSRTGQYEYINTEEAVGDIGQPDSVSFPGPGLQFVVNTILGSENHAGRLATVYLKDNPASDNPAVAFETVALTWNGSQNILLITGTLGQSSPSLTANDYEILVEGPTVRQAASPGATLKGSPGVCYIGSVQGIGSPGVPVTFDTSQQTVYDVVADASQVLYKDVHGFVKIRVTADPFDVDEPQISVWDNSLNNVLTITDTRIYANKDLEIDAPGGGAVTPSLKFTPGAGTYVWEMFADETNPPTVLHLGRNDAAVAARTLRISNIGGGGPVDVQTDGAIRVGDGTGIPSPGLSFEQGAPFAGVSPFFEANGPIVNLKINDPGFNWLFQVANLDGTNVFNFSAEGYVESGTGRFQSTSNPITFDDSIIATPVALSETGINSLNTFHQSILGAAYDFDRMFDEALGNSISYVTDLAVTGTLSTPPRIQIGSGAAIVFGNRVELPGTTTVALTPTSSGWVVVNAAGGMSYHTTADAAIAAGLPLVYVVVGATSVTSYQEIRKIAADAADDNLELTVGDQGQFPDFENAIAFLDMLSQTSPGLIGAHWRFRLSVVGDVPLYSGAGITIPATIQNLTIEGQIQPLGTTRSVLTWDGSGPYFVLADGLTGLTVRHIAAQYVGGAPPANDTYLFNGDNANINGIIGTTIEKCIVLPGVGGTGGLFRARNSTLNFSYIRDNLVQADLSLVDFATSTANRTYLQSNAAVKLAIGGTPSTTYNVIDLGDSGERNYVENNNYTNSSALGSHVDGIKLTNGSIALVRNNHFSGQPVPTGYAINLSGTDQAYIEGNAFVNANLTDFAMLSGGILASRECYILNNTIVNGGDPADAIARNAIEVSFAPSAALAAIQISGNTIQDFRGTNSVYGIYLNCSVPNGSSIRVTDNVMSDIGDSGIVGLQVSSVYCAGNFIKDFGNDVAGPAFAIALGTGPDHTIVDNYILSTVDLRHGISLGSDGCVCEGNNVYIYANAASQSIGIQTGGVVAGCVIVGNRVVGGEDGILLQASSTGCVVSNNYIDDQAQHGISVQGPKNSIGNNVIWQPGGNGIDLNASGDNCSIYGNVVDAPTGFGVDLNTGADNNIVGFNQTGGGGVNDSGAGNTVVNNI